MFKKNNEFNIIFYAFVLLIAIAIIIKFIAPYSGLGSRLGLKGAIELKLPKYADKTKPITIGRTDNIKWICFYDTDGNIRLTEISDLGIWQAEYILKLKE